MELKKSEIEISVGLSRDKLGGDVDVSRYRYYLLAMPFVQCSSVLISAEI